MLQEQREREGKLDKHVKNGHRKLSELTWLIAVGEGISLGALWTAADGTMLLCQTLSCARTGRCIQAWIDTVAGAASLRILALIVRNAALVTSGFCEGIETELVKISSGSAICAAVKESELRVCRIYIRCNCIICATLL